VAANHILQQNGLHFVPQKSAGKTSKQSIPETRRNLYAFPQLKLRVNRLPCFSGMF
jgi:O-phosphoseryl-tRNA(Cys) synthetase